MWSGELLIQRKANLPERYDYRSRLGNMRDNSAESVNYGVGRGKRGECGALEWFVGCLTM